MKKNRHRKRCGRLHEYLGGLVRAANGIPEAIGGVHLLAGLRPTHALASLMSDIKQTSSRWIHETIGANNFVWQPGCGVFTVSVSNCDVVKNIVRIKLNIIGQKHFRKNMWRFSKNAASNMPENIHGEFIE